MPVLIASLCIAAAANAASSAATSGRPAGRCAASGPRTVLETQVSTPDPSASRAWTLLIVGGARSDAGPVCRRLRAAALRRSRVPPTACRDGGEGSDAEVEAELRTGCRPFVAPSTGPATGPAEVSTYALVRTETFAAEVELALEGGDACLLQRAARVHVVRRDVALFADPDACEDARLERHRGDEEVRLQASRDAGRWLAEALRRQRAETEALCAADPTHTRCETGRRLLRMLEERAALTSTASADVLECLPATALALYPLLTALEQPDLGTVTALIEADLEAELANQRYGVKHPQWLLAHTRLAERAAAAVPRASAPSAALAAWLDAKLLDVVQREGESTAEGPLHPNRRRRALERRVLERWRELAAPTSTPMR